MTKERKTQVEILSVARALFAQYGFRGTTTAMIAQGVGIQTPSLYYFFKNKEEIYVTLLTETIEMLSELFSVEKELEPTLSKLFSIMSKESAIVYSINTLNRKNNHKIQPLIIELKKEMRHFFNAHKLRCSSQEAVVLTLDTSDAYGRKYARGEDVLSPEAYAKLLSQLIIK